MRSIEYCPVESMATETSEEWRDNGITWFTLGLNTELIQTPTLNGPC